MPEGREYDDHPELLLSGSDRPRELPAALRARLEELLAAAAVRPLSPEVRGRLESSLVPTKRGKGARSWRKSWNWRTTVLTVGAAAAVAVLAGLVVPGLVHRSSTNVTATKPMASALPGATPLRRAAAPSARHSTATPFMVTPRVTNGAAAPGVPASRFGLPGSAVAGGLAASGVISVEKVNPPSGPTSGGNTVVIEGRGLYGVNYVLFGASEASDVRDLSPTKVEAVAPAHEAGAVYVRLKGAAGTTPVSAEGRYIFVGR